MSIPEETFLRFVDLFYDSAVETGVEPAEAVKMRATMMKMAPQVIG
jgi:hypothetical protein